MRLERIIIGQTAGNGITTNFQRNMFLLSHSSWRIDCWAECTFRVISTLVNCQSREKKQKMRRKANKRKQPRQSFWWIAAKTHFECVISIECKYFDAFISFGQSLQILFHYRNENRLARVLWLSQHQEWWISARAIRRSIGLSVGFMFCAHDQLNNIASTRLLICWVKSTRLKVGVPCDEPS